MDEYTRIAELLKAGKITVQEAEELLRALDERPLASETGGAEPPVDGAGALHVRLRSADLRVRTDPTLDEPVLETQDEPALRLERRHGGWRLSETRETSGLEGLLAFLKPARRVKASVRVPTEFDLSVAMGTGSLVTVGALGRIKFEAGQGKAQLEAARELRLEMGLGSLELGWAEGVHVELGQGNASLGLQLNKGAHRVESGMGRVAVTLLEGSDVRVKVSTGMGKVRVVGLSAEDDGGEVVVGEGSARLRIKTGMGDVEVRLP